MSDTCNLQNNEPIFHFNRLFEMCENLKLCEEFYYLTSKDDSYKNIMNALGFLSSCKEQDFLKSLLNMSDEYSVLFDLVIYVYMSQCSYKDLSSAGGSLLPSLNKTINLNQYSKHAQHILELLQKDDASYTTADKLLTPMYPLQNKIILFDKELVQIFVDKFSMGKKAYAYSERIHSSQMYFKRMLKKFGLAAIENILFPECTEKRKSYRIPVCSLSALTFIFLVYHNPRLPLETQFSVLSDSFINIAVAKGLDLQDILNILYILKEGFENYKTTLPQNKPDSFFEFLRPLGKSQQSVSLTAQDLYCVHDLIFTEYMERRDYYVSKIKRMEEYRKIEKCILETFDKWCREPKNMVNLQRTIRLSNKSEGTNEYPKINAKELIKYLDPAFPDYHSEYFTLEEAIDQFFSTFQYAVRQYKPIPSIELFHLLEKTNILESEMFRPLSRLTYSPGIVYSNDITGQSSFFSPFPLSINRDKKQK